ncbi:hypothetical protein [Mycobacterium barrassiae]|uniref:hypothetical protein n=1 Tax=Mycobacterium barrassiae TaxID=319709 RepID=UPI002265E7C2|nr:hypothetical protein [Mycobacterium barrassiae]
MDSADNAASSNDDAEVWGGVGPKPWWFDDPEILAARRRVVEEFGDEPDESAVSDVPEGEVCDASVSSVDDAAGLEGAWGGVGPKPWWFDDPQILAARQRVLEEFGGEPDDRPLCTDPDPILNDVLSGASVRELGQARDDLARAKARYDEAVRSARECGLSWGEIGAALGVPRQLLHRRFARRLG